MEKLNRFDVELDGRVAMSEIKLYDETMAEIIDEHMARKMRRVQKPDNRTREKRLADWDAEKKRRKDAYYRSIEKRICREYQSGKNPLLACNAEKKIRNAEKSRRSDYEIELQNVSEEIRNELQELTKWLEWA